MIHNLRQWVAREQRAGGFKFEAEKPIGTPRSNPMFYECVALQHWALRQLGESNPTRRMVEINNAPLSTVQSWVTGARKRGYLSPGRPGRAG